ncbi:sugar porter family MFS transporter [Acidobacteria bacterium AB60]|nr:sugar porter family MFS transporter [Acidobacteria bacterium AB60]
MPSAPESTPAPSLARYNRFLLFVAGLGGLLYGIDVGIIGGALPYLQATSRLTPAELSIVVAAVLLGSVFSTLFAGLIADWLGRKPLMLLSGIAFTLSVPVIALSQGYTALLLGRLLQGISGGLVGVVVPLYLAECLSAKERGRGTAVFQWLLTFGIFAASLIGVYYSYHVDAIAKSGNADALFAAKNSAWRQIFWMSMPPGLIFVLGSFFVSESPRWLFRRGKRSQAEAALLRSRTPQQAALELNEMAQIAADTAHKPGHATGSLLQRRYILPFLLACVILACNTATGINSVIGFNTNILLEGGLSDVLAHWGYVVFTGFNFLMTLIGMQLVDRKGRKFLFTVGTTGIIISMIAAGILFHRTESRRFDVRAAIQPLVNQDQQLSFRFDQDGAARLAAAGAPTQNASLTVIYSYGPFSGTTTPARLNDPPVEIHRSEAVPTSKVEAFFHNPFADLDTGRTAPLTIDHAYLTPVPSSANGWLVALFLYAFVAFYAMGPGVCVWLALSELMPTRIRSNGMSIALVLNQFVSTTLAAIFLPMVGKHGYSSMFFLFASFTVVYLITVVFFLPETKGKTLEEIEKFFERA